MSTPTRKLKVLKQTSILDLFTKKRPRADPSTNCDPSKRKKDDSRPTYCLQPPATTFPSCDIIAGAPCAEVEATSSLSGSDVSCSFAGIGDSTSRVDTANFSIQSQTDDFSSLFGSTESSSCAGFADCSSWEDHTDNSFMGSDVMLQKPQTEPVTQNAKSVVLKEGGNLVTDLSTNPYHGPVQPKLPANQLLKFNSDYKTHPWLEYSILKDGLYCFACRHFSALTLDGRRECSIIPLVDIGFCEWENRSCFLKKHAESEVHQSSFVAWVDFVKQNAAHHRFAANLVTLTDRAIEENRRHVLLLLKVTCFLGRQALAFQVSESQDYGTKSIFIELLELMSGKDEKLRLKMAKRYEYYTSPAYQKELISVVASLVRENIAKKVTKYFSLLIDETKDLSDKEQLSFVIRFVDGDGNVQEKALGCYHMEKLDASSLAAAIDDSVCKAGLHWKNCVAQCYSGASLMCGPFKGLQAQIRHIAPQAMYVHCHVHWLTLAFLQTVSNVQEVREFFSTLEAVYAFLSPNSPQHDLFVKAQTESGLGVCELDRPATTTWVYGYISVKKIQLRFETIVVVLSAISLQQHKKTSSLEAQKILGDIQNFGFLVTLLSMEVVLRKINCLSDELRGKDHWWPFPSNLVEVTRRALVDLLQDGRWTELVNEAKRLAEQCGIEVGEESSQVRLPVTSQQLIKKLTDYFDSAIEGERDCPYEDPESRRPYCEHLKQTVYVSTIDRFVSELDDRFTDNLHILTAFSMFHPKAQNYMELSSAHVIADQYPETSINPFILQSQLESAKSYLSNKNVPDIHSLRKHLLCLPGAFSEVLDLLHLALALPITRVSNERFFSCLKRVKRYLQNIHGDHRLSDLMVMACDPAEVELLNLDDAIERLAEMPQKMDQLKK